MWENIIHAEGEELPDDTKALIIEYLHPKFRKLFGELYENPFIFFLNGHKPFKTVQPRVGKSFTRSLKPFFQGFYRSKTILR